MQTESVVNVCHPCSQRGISTEVALVCSECKEGMCRSCSEEHEKQPENALHRVTEIGSSRGCKFVAANVKVSNFGGQIILPMPKINYQGNFNMPDPPNYISSMVVMNDNRVLMCNTSANHLLVYSENGSLIEKCHLKGQPWDIGVIGKGDKAVVTLESRLALQFINTTPSVVACRTLPLKWKCYGVAVIDKFIYLGSRGEIHVLDKAGQHLSSIDVGHKGFIWYIQNGPDGKLFYTSFDYNEVVCYDPITKKELFKYGNETFKGPEAIAFDKSGCIYVACRGKGNIQRLTSHGEYKGVILGVDDKIDKPYGLAFNSTCSKMFVSNCDGTAVSIFVCTYGKLI